MNQEGQVVFNNVHISSSAKTAFKIKLTLEGTYIIDCCKLVRSWIYMKLFKFEDKNKVRSVIILIICSIILAVYILCNSDRIIRHYNAYQNIGADVVGISGWHIVMAVLALEIYMVIISCLSVRTYKIFKNYKVGNNEDENRILVAILFLIIVVLLLILLEWAYWNIDLIRIAVFVITED